MSWSLEGRYFENCSGEVVCPCTASLALGADYDYCRVILAFHVDSGEVDGVDVGGLTLAAIAESPKYMHEGNWRIGLLIDDSASDEQAEKLGAVFGGQLGGLMSALEGLIGEVLGVERVPIESSSRDGQHSVSMADRGKVSVENVVPFGSETGEPARLTRIFHPVGTELDIAKSADDSALSAFGIDLDIAGRSGLPMRFS